MKRGLFAFLFLIALVSCNDKPVPPSAFADMNNTSNQQTEEGASMPSPEGKLEIPKTNPRVPSKRLTRTGYDVSYNSTWRIPNWVAYELTKREVQAHRKREGEFTPDSDVGRSSADNSDYKRSGYSRGHMAPAGDMKWNGRAMHESFLLTNVCPQNYDLNAGVWEDLESALRDHAYRNNNVYIVCGPIVSEGYKTIGRNRVCVPQKFFKVVCWKRQNEWRCKAFVFPNQNLKGRFHDYSTTVDEVERLTGHDFFSLLPDHIENRIESRDNKGHW